MGAKYFNVEFSVDEKRQHDRVEALNGTDAERIIKKRFPTCIVWSSREDVVYTVLNTVSGLLLAEKLLPKQYVRGADVLIGNFVADFAYLVNENPHLTTTDIKNLIVKQFARFNPFSG
jgi:hypothetical protein